MKHRVARRIQKSYWMRNLVGFPLSFILLVAVFHSARYSYYRLAPRSVFVNYQQMEARQEGKEVVVSVTRTTKLGTKLEFTDALHCDRGLGFRLVSIDTSKGFARKDGLVSYEWSYLGEKPTTTSTCYLQSLVVANLPYGIDKQQIVTTPNFIWTNNYLKDKE